jgi:hypothetical protein
LRKLMVGTVPVAISNSSEDKQKGHQAKIPI